MTHTRSIVGPLLAAVGALALGGCYYDFGHGGHDPTSTPPSTVATGPTGSEPVTRWSGMADRFGGDLGNVRRFAGGDPVITAADYGASTSSVRIDAEDTAARWWAMTSLNFSGSIHHPLLVPGARFVFTPGSGAMGGGGATALYVSALGCSGPRRNDYTYDHSAEQVTVAVSEGPAPQTRRMDFDAQFAGPGGEQHVTGSFVFDTQ